MKKNTANYYRLSPFLTCFFFLLFALTACDKTRDCDDINCQNGGDCLTSDPGGVPYCDCPIGYTGAICEIELCSLAICLNGGNCIVNENTGLVECDCPPGFGGVSCEVEIDYTACEDVVCLNGGTCFINEQSGLAECDCPPGFIGLYCEMQYDLCDDVICLNGGTCVINEATGLAECDCPPGFAGQSCENDLCDEISCPPNTFCTEGICFCDIGYTGSDCDTLVRDRYLGVYDGLEVCVDSEQDSNTIEASTFNDDSFLFIDLGLGVFDIRAEVVSANSFQIPYQLDYLGNSYEGVLEDGTEHIGAYDPANNSLFGIYTVTYTDGTSKTCYLNWEKIE